MAYLGSSPSHTGHMKWACFHGRPVGGLHCTHSATCPAVSMVGSGAPTWKERGARASSSLLGALGRVCNCFSGALNQAGDPRSAVASAPAFRRPMCGQGLLTDGPRPFAADFLIQRLRPIPSFWWWTAVLCFFVVGCWRCRWGDGGGCTQR